MLQGAMEPVDAIRVTLGAEEGRLVYVDGSTATQEPTPAEVCARFCLTDDDVLRLARWACLIESHYSALVRQPRPMDHRIG
jgi:pyruvate,water dikinase